MQTSLIQAHGDSDEVVTYSRGVKTSKILEKHFSNHKLITYKGIHFLYSNNSNYVHLSPLFLL